MPELAAWNAFRRRCLKPNSDRVGTWTARRIARPLALHITWVVAPLGVTAHQATLSAALAAMIGLVALGEGSAGSWLLGALLLELWYVLDHVDGQLARHCGTASLDGTTLDYLMHHSINLLLPTALGYGLLRQTGEPLWCLAGAAWSWGMLMIGLRHDARYKSFIQRLKQLHGTLHVVGGGGGRPVPAAWPQPQLRAWLQWCVLKGFEAHTLAHLLLAAAIIRCSFPAIALQLAQATAAVPAVTAIPLAVYLVRRDLQQGEAERQFAAWFRVPNKATLEFYDGRWFVGQAVVKETTDAEPIETAG